MAFERPQSSMTPKYWPEETPSVPFIGDKESLSEVLRKLSIYITDAILSPHSFEELRSKDVSQRLSPLIDYLADSCHNRTMVCGLLALKSFFTALENDENRGVNLTRGLACEYVAWRFLTHLTGRESIKFLLYELPKTAEAYHDDEEAAPLQNDTRAGAPLPTETTLGYAAPEVQDPAIENGAGQRPLDSQFDEFALSFQNLNALEIAAVSDAKKFLSQRVVQRIIEAIWRGDIIFWSTLDIHSEKEAEIYNKKKADPFCRLRVPRYLKTLEALFFVSFLAVYFAVLIPVQRSGSRPRKPGMPPLSSNTGHISTDDQTHSFHHITVAEILLYIWIVAFAYDEFGEYRDAGSAFYSADFWSVWDISIVLIGLAFFICRMIGLSQDSNDITGTAFDILATQALFLLPRLCSILSLNPYFGTLIPCLREMTKDFFKFLMLVIILYLGFLTTFTLLARDNFTLREMFWILTKIFFGSSYLGFDVAQAISPVLGPPLMLVFITLTNILLITSLISLLSNSLSKILEHAREEYLYIYSIYVLEASTSNRLTYFLPPLNLIPLALRPLRIFLAPEVIRRTKIRLLRITHAPFVAAIWIFESLTDRINGSTSRSVSAISSLGGPVSGTAKRPPFLRNFTPRTVAALNGGQSIVNPSRDGRMKRTQSRPATATIGQDWNSDNDLRSLIVALSSRVEDIASMMAEKQGTNPDSES